MMRFALTALLEHPLIKGLDIDDPQTTRAHAEIIRQKRFLQRIYSEWYELIRNSLPAGASPVLELGSGAGFLSQLIPNVITSDVFPLPGVKIALDGHRLPFRSQSLRAIVMTDVFHHLPDCARFLTEAARCVEPGGAIVAVEPWVTPWSRLIYGRFHHEPFDPQRAAWSFPSDGPLSGANGALPWIVFQRDRHVFERQFPEWKLAQIRLFMPFRYLLSGGVSLRSLTPEFSFGFWRFVETVMPCKRFTAMFAHLVLTREP